MRDLTIEQQIRMRNRPTPHWPADCWCEECRPDSWRNIEGRALEAENSDLRSRLAAAEAWQRDVADGLGYLNRPEGQGGYEVAEPRVIIDAFRAAEAAREAAEREREALMVEMNRAKDDARAYWGERDEARARAEAAESTVEAMRGASNAVLARIDACEPLTLLGADHFTVAALRALASAKHGAPRYEWPSESASEPASPSPRTTPPEDAPRSVGTPAQVAKVRALLDAEPPLCPDCNDTGWRRPADPRLTYMAEPCGLCAKGYEAGRSSGRPETATNTDGGNNG